MNRAVVFSEIIEIIRELKSGVSSEIDALRASFENDTKSSAGDKYETSREMTQQEIAKLELSLRQKNEQLTLLEHHRNLSDPNRIQPGSILSTNAGIFVLGIPFGRVELKNYTVFGLGKEAPLSLLFLKSAAGSEVSLNGRNYTIGEVY